MESNMEHPRRAITYVYVDAEMRLAAIKAARRERRITIAYLLFMMGVVILTLAAQAFYPVPVF